MFDTVRVRAADSATATRELRRLTTELRAAVPEVAFLIIAMTWRGNGLSLYDAHGHPLGLDPLDPALMDDLMAFFGLGCWVLTGSGLHAARVRSVTS